MYNNYVVLYNSHLILFSGIYGSRNYREGFIINNNQWSKVTAIFGTYQDG